MHPESGLNELETGENGVDSAGTKPSSGWSGAPFLFQPAPERQFMCDAAIRPEPEARGVTHHDEYDVADDTDHDCRQPEIEPAQVHDPGAVRGQRRIRREQEAGDDAHPDAASVGPGGEERQTE